MEDSEDNQPQPEQEVLPVLVSCLDSSTVVVENYVNDTVLVLQEAILARVGIPRCPIHFICVSICMCPPALAPN